MLKTVGLGLSCSKHTISSLYSLAYSGNANTVRCFVSSTSSSMVSGSKMNGDFSPAPPSSAGRVEPSVKATSALYLPLLVIYRTLELTRAIVASLARRSGSFLISKGPKSKVFSLTTNVLARRLSACWMGLVFLWFMNTFL